MSKRITITRVIGICIVLVVLSLLIIVCALHCGAIAVSSKQIFRIISHHMGFSSFSEEEQLVRIIWDIRLMRILLGFLVGMALSVSGCVFQALLRNPLADPHILGVSSGGALGAVLATVLGVPVMLNSFIAVPLFSFIGALTAIGIVYALSKRRGALSMYSLLLIGVVLNSFFISIVIFIESVISADQLASIFFWLLGNLAHHDHQLIGMISVAIVVGVGILFFHARQINLFTLGETKAQQLGVSVERTKAICFICASVITGLAVSVSGLIGFVGLVVPHIVRLIFGPDHRIVIPASGLIGGIFLVCADTIARTILLPQELPVGVVTSFIGAPFFILLLKKREQKRIF